MSQARENILQRLKQRTSTSAAMPVDPGVLIRDWDEAECVKRFTNQLISNHADVVTTKAADLASALINALSARNARSVVLGRSHPFAEILPMLNAESIRPVIYQDAIEDWQDALFNDCDAAITTTLGGIAETGSLMLWPGIDEPRLMSLVPPLHIAVVAQSRLCATFAQAIAEPGWQGQLPTNVLLISGPSKTADIEQTLVYGAHGPSKLVVVLVEDQ